MPKRARSHVTGEAAVKAFNELIPELWVSREKNAGDYGVDIEVEIFVDDSTGAGVDTGLVFNVQSKGTEDDSAGLPFSMEVETLRYLVSFDVPAIVFRHSTTTGRSYWLWATEALSRAKKDKRTVAIRLADENEWTEETPREILQSLISIRLLKERPKWLRFPLFNATAQNIEESRRYAELFGKLTRSLPMLDANAAEEGVPVHVHIVGNSIEVAVERVHRFTADFDPSIPGADVATLAYLVLNFVSRHGFDRQAEQMAQSCVEKSWKAPNNELASGAALASLGRPKIAINIAVLNELHLIRDQHAALFALALRNVVSVFPEHSDEFVDYSKIEIEAQSEDQSRANLCYSLGNFQRSQGNYAEAIRLYNSARKYEPDYLNRTYFYREVGGILFMSSHFRCAAKAYEKLVEIEPAGMALLYLGDAYLYGFELDAAETVFAQAANSDPTSIGAEAKLKGELAKWLKQRGLPVKLKDYEDLFKLRKQMQEAEDFNGTLWAHIALTFYFEDDPECWADVYFLSMVQLKLDLLSDALLCGAKRCGIEAFNLMLQQRASFFEQLGDGADELKEVALKANRSVQSEENYEPGMMIGEPERLAQDGVLRMIPKPGLFS